jgi:hypothetical protein
MDLVLSVRAEFHIETKPMIARDESREWRSLCEGAFADDLLLLSRSNEEALEGVEITTGVCVILGDKR